MTDLPEPHKLFTERTGHPVYTATQMREYRNQALEEAAKVAVDRMKYHPDLGAKVAEQILALKEQK